MIKEPKLSIEMVPSSSWYSNVRSQVTTAEWNRLRRACYQAAENKCEICGGVGRQHPVECHEVWRYEEAGVQKLERLIALCPACHQVKHFGLATTRGRTNEAIRHLAKVNGWSTTEAERYADHCWAVWEQRSTQNWQVDVSCLGLESKPVQQKPKSRQRSRPC